MPLRWVLTPQCPAAWNQELARCRGGFFHAPPGLGAGAPRGEPVFATLLDGDEVLGLALGVRHACRLTSRPRHVYFPSLPALTPTVNPVEALNSLAEEFTPQAAVELTLDSFDARWTPGSGLTGEGGSPRLEYIVPLEGDADALARRCGTTHRRRVRRGEREGWVLRTLAPAEALALLAEIKRSPRARQAAEDGAVDLPAEAIAASSPDLRADWGVATFSAWRGETPLAAALVGWANRRGFYVLGGSTEDGYQCSAAVWLHWRIMALLGAAGYSVYNLGGTPATAVETADPQHGLHRFKAEFGAEVVERRGVLYRRRSAHLKAHELLRRLQALLGT